jgi:hypothetical protein
MALAALLKRI